MLCAGRLPGGKQHFSHKVNYLSQKKRVNDGGVWVAQSVERPTLDFGSGHDLRVVGLSLTLGSTVCVQSA